MTKCEFCGFDDTEESIRVAGAPCGIDDCPLFFCCMKRWEKHKKVYHNKENQ